MTLNDLRLFCGIATLSSMFFCTVKMENYLNKIFVVAFWCFLWLTFTISLYLMLR